MSIASFLAKLGAQAPPPTLPQSAGGHSQTRGVTLLSTLRPGEEPLSFIWTYRRPSPAQSPADLGLELDADMVVRHVKPYSPADDAQVKTGLILLRVNGHTVRSTTEFFVHVQKSVEVTISFFDGDPVAEAIAKVAQAPLSDNGRAVEPDLKALYESNPTRYGFLSAASPLFEHWSHRHEKARDARDALHKIEWEERCEHERREAERQLAMAAEIDDLDELLADDAKDSDQPSTADGTAGKSASVTAVPSADDPAARAPKSQQQRAKIFVLEDDDEEENPITTSASNTASPQPPLATQAAFLPPPSYGAQHAVPVPSAPPTPNPQLDLLRSAIMGTAMPPVPPPHPPVILPTGPMVFPPHFSGMPLLMPPMFNPFGLVGPPTTAPPTAAPLPSSVVGPIKRTEPKPPPPESDPPPLRPPPENQSRRTSEKTRRDVCLDYQRGRCDRVNCVFEHEDPPPRRDSHVPRSPDRRRHRDYDDRRRPPPQPRAPY